MNDTNDFLANHCPDPNWSPPPKPTRAWVETFLASQGVSTGIWHDNYVTLRELRVQAREAGIPVPATLPRYELMEWMRANGVEPRRRSGRLRPAHAPLGRSAE